MSPELQAPESINLEPLSLEQRLTRLEQENRTHQGLLTRIKRENRSTADSGAQWSSQSSLAVPTASPLPSPI